MTPPRLNRDEKAGLLLGLCIGAFIGIAVSAALIVVSAAPCKADDLGGVDVNDRSTFAAVPDRCQGRTAPCKITDGRRTVIAWGDSHLAQQLPGLIARAKAEDVSLVVFTTGGCPAHLPTGSTPCDRMARSALRFIDRHPRATVVLGAYWDYYTTTARSVRPTAELFRQLDGVKLAAIAPQPVLADVCSIEATTCPRADLLPNEAATKQWLARQGAHLVDTARFVCPDACYVRGVFTDAYHMRPALSKQMTSAYDWVF